MTKDQIEDKIRDAAAELCLKNKYSSLYEAEIEELAIAPSFLAGARMGFQLGWEACREELAKELYSRVQELRDEVWNWGAPKLFEDAPK